MQKERAGKWPRVHIEVLKSTYMEAGVSTEKLTKNRELFFVFMQHFMSRLAHGGGDAEYSFEEVSTQLERLRKSGQLGKLRARSDDLAHPRKRKPASHLFQDL